MEKFTLEMRRRNLIYLEVGGWGQQRRSKPEPDFYHHHLQNARIWVQRQQVTALHQPDNVLLFYIAELLKNCYRSAPEVLLALLLPLLHLLSLTPITSAKEVQSPHRSVASWFRPTCYICTETNASMFAVLQKHWKNWLSGQVSPCPDCTLYKLPVNGGLIKL